jgi:hypothetical protein
MHVGNGILSRVPGEYIGAASQSLPAAVSAPDQVMSVEIDAGWLGRVRLTFEKHKYHRPKGKFSAVSWSCKHAELVAPPEQPAPDLPS